MIQFHPTGLIIPGKRRRRGTARRGFARRRRAFVQRQRRALHAQLCAGCGGARDPRCGEPIVVSGNDRTAERVREGGVHIDASHLGADFVLKNFPGHGRAMQAVQLRSGSRSRADLPHRSLCHGWRDRSTPAAKRHWKSSSSPAKTPAVYTARIVWAAMESANRACMVGRRARHWRSICRMAIVRSRNPARGQAEGDDRPARPDDESHQRVESLRAEIDASGIELEQGRPGAKSRTFRRRLTRSKPLPSEAAKMRVVGGETFTT